MIQSISVATLLLVIFLRQGYCITVSPSTAYSLIPDPVTFVCMIQAGTCSMVTWSGPALTEESSRVRISGISGTQLEITDLRSEDEGEYSCFCNGKEGTAYLEVTRLPTIVPDTTQTIEEQNPANILCPADPGDPPVHPLWLFNGEDIPDRYNVENDLVLRIENVRMEDAGIYTCAFNTARGLLRSNINVTVVPPNGEIVFLEPTRRAIVISYGIPLDLNCVVDSSTPVNISWIVLGSSTQTSRLVLQPDEVRTGLYVCFAYNNKIEKSYGIYVTVNAKPVFPELRTDGAVIVKASEGSVLEHREMTVNRAPSFGGRTTIQWRRKESGGELVEFGSRLTAYWSENHLTWSIRTANLDDNGQYIMNVSNEFGWTDLPTTLRVARVLKKTVSVLISDQPCQFLKDHRLELARTIAGRYSVCQTTCEDSLLETGVVRCVDDGSSAIVSLSIPEDYCDPTVTTISFRIVTSESTSEFTGTVIKSPVTSPPKTDPTNEPHTSPPNNIIVPVVVVVASISIIIVLAVILTVVIKKTRCSKRNRDEVNPEDPGSNNDKMGYMEVNRNEDKPVAPSSSVTLVGVAITPVYIPPSPKPEKGKTPPPQGTDTSAKPAAERPRKLYFRSHSYSYSGRTPPDHRSRQQ